MHGAISLSEMQWISDHSQHRSLLSLFDLQVMASKTKIYIVLEYVDGGELFDKIVRTLLILFLQLQKFYLYGHHQLSLFFFVLITYQLACKSMCSRNIIYGCFIFQARQGRLKEDEARKYFQQLINAVDYCHSRGVYHRDLKV